MLFGIVTVIILILDQLLKNEALRYHIAHLEDKILIPNILNFTYTENKGIAFGIGDNLSWFRWVLVAVAIGFSILVIYLLAKKIIRGSFGRWTATIVMAGALGNCIDRALPDRGYVIDMFEFKFVNFAIFNLADAFLTVGMILFCFYIIFHKEAPVAEGADGASPEKAGRRTKTENVEGIERISRPSVDELTDRLPSVGSLRAAQERAGQNPRPIQPRPRPMPQHPAEQPLSPDKRPPIERVLAREPREERIEATQTPQAPQTPPKPQPEDQLQRRKSDADLEFSLDDILDEFRD